MAGSLVVSTWLTSRSVEGQSYPLLVRSSDAVPQAHGMSASTIWSSDHKLKIRGRSTSPLRSVLVNCRVTHALLDNAESYPSLYGLLGLDHDVALPDIKTAYRQMARQYHPDVCPKEKVEECTRKFLQVQDAYDTLSDPERRAEYDFELSCGRSGGSPGWRFQDHRQSRNSTDSWKSKWEQQLEILVKRNETDQLSQSWGARMRRTYSQK